MKFSSKFLRLSKFFTVVIQPLSTRLIKPNFCFHLPLRPSTTVSLETRNPFTAQLLRPCSSLATPKLTMPNLKTLTKELRQEIVSYLYPFPSISSNLAFQLVIHIFTKTRFSSHINFISRCLQHSHSQRFPFKFSRVHFFQCFQFQPKIPSRNSAYPKHCEKHESHVLKTQAN